MNSSSSGSVPKHVLRLPKSRLYMSFSCLISSSIFAISGGAPTYHHTHPNSHNSSIIEYKTTTIKKQNKKKKVDLMTIYVSLKKARIVRMRSDLSFNGGRSVIIWWHIRSYRSRLRNTSSGDEFIGTKSDSSCVTRIHDQRMIIRRKDQIIRRHQRLIGIITTCRMKPVQFIHHITVLHTF